MPLPDLKRLVTRLVAVQHVRPARAALGVELAAQQRIADKILEWFLDESAIQPQLASSRFSVQDVLALQLQSAHAIRTLLKSAEEKRYFDRFYRALSARINEQLCSKCSLGSGHTCNGDPKLDPLQLESPGLCIAVFNDCLQYLSAQVTDMIRGWAQLGELADAAGLDLSVARRFINGPAQSGHPWRHYNSQNNSLGRHHASGWVDFDDHPAPAPRRSRVTLEFDGQRFDWPSMLCVPWLITHELVCHVYQGRAGVKRSPCERDCPFYEGWMDEVAYLLHMEDVEFGRYRKTTVGRPALFSSQGHLLHAETREFRRARYGPESPWGRPEPEATLWGGCQAARNVLSFFRERINNDANEALDYQGALPSLVRLSFRIQRFDPDPHQARELVGCLGHAAACVIAEQHPESDRDQLHELLSEPGVDLLTWLNALRQLSRKLGYSVDDSFDK